MNIDDWVCGDAIYVAANPTKNARPLQVGSIGSGFLLSKLSVLDIEILGSADGCQMRVETVSS